MDVVNLCCFGEGYHSGATYEENIAVSKEVYEKCKDKISDLKVYLGELDGKHSCVNGEIEAQYFSEEMIPEAGFDETYNDGDSMYQELKSVFNLCALDLDAEIAKVSEYIKSLDLIVKITVNVKRSNAEKVVAFANSLL